MTPGTPVRILARWYEWAPESPLPLADGVRVAEDKGNIVTVVYRGEVFDIPAVFVEEVDDDTR